ncbi:CZB domain-containing protein [Hymenobacter algoricola]|uniref:Chemoreceptor zinc-binding domain-containing protein n=1 Tax=Hymenobacter algoricola TaxID=486267 RepID=A0ABP7NKV2_9BACT
MNPELKQDFETAMVKHLLFKSKLRSFLYGTNLAEGPIRNPDQCGLGIWIQSRRQRFAGNLPEWAELDRIHRQLHLEANRLMDMRLQGHAEAAIAGMDDIKYLVDQVTALLRTLEDKLRTGR